MSESPSPSRASECWTWWNRKYDWSPQLFRETMQPPGMGLEVPFSPFLRENHDWMSEGSKVLKADQ